MKRPLIIQNAKMDSWHLIDWLEISSSVRYTREEEEEGDASSAIALMECEVLFECQGSF